MKKKNHIFSKFIVLLIITLTAVFTAWNMVIFREVGVEQTVLIGGWYGFAASELIVMSSMKKKEKEIESKTKNHKGGM